MAWEDKTVDVRAKPVPRSEEYERVVAWLRSLGNKYLGDGIHESMRASTILEAIELEIGQQREREEADSDKSNVVAQSRLEG